MGTALLRVESDRRGKAIASHQTAKPLRNLLKKQELGGLLWREIKNWGTQCSWLIFRILSISLMIRRVGSITMELIR